MPLYECGSLRKLRVDSLGYINAVQCTWFGSFLCKPTVMHSYHDWPQDNAFTVAQPTYDFRLVIHECRARFRIAIPYICLSVCPFVWCKGDRRGTKDRERASVADFGMVIILFVSCVRILSIYPSVSSVGFSLVRFTTNTTYSSINLVFTARCTLVQSAVLR